MRTIDTFKVDKEEFSVLSSFEEADAADKSYWYSKTPQERMAALELMRQINYGYDPTTERLQRVRQLPKPKDLDLLRVRRTTGVV